MAKDNVDNLKDVSLHDVIFQDGPHRGRYITHGKARKWYSLEVGDTGTYAYYVLANMNKVGRGKTKSIVYVYVIQQIDGPDTAMANLKREWKRDGKKYDLEKV